MQAACLHSCSSHSREIRPPINIHRVSEPSPCHKTLPVGRCVRHQPHSVWCSVVDHNAKRRLGCWSRIGCRHSCSSPAASTALHSLHISSTNGNGKTTHQQQRPWPHVQHAWQTRRSALLPRGTISLLVAPAHSFRAEQSTPFDAHTHTHMHHQQLFAHGFKVLARS
jgi:hypothetical protein